MGFTHERAYDENNFNSFLGATQNFNSITLLLRIYFTLFLKPHIG